MSNELQHHGIKGQKWGVRRFQNKNGTLTPAGKKRYNNDDATPEEQQKKHAQQLDAAGKVIKGGKDFIGGQQKKQASKKAAKAKAKAKDDLSKLSDKDLQQIVNRLNMEERYTQIMQGRYAEQGKSKADTILDYAGKALTIGGSVISIMAAIKELKK